MAQTSQTRENHTRFDPLFHFFLAPASLLLLILTVIRLIRHPNGGAALMAATALILCLAIFKTRIYALKVQDRVIRVEERLRLQALGDTTLRARIHELTEPQLIALRFASDAEVSALATRALDQNMGLKEIKAAIQQWRPDYFRA